MAKLTAAQRRALKPNQFVFPKARKYPIHDISHARNALARGSAQFNKGNLTAMQYNQIVRAVNARYGLNSQFKPISKRTTMKGRK